jgi:hypothetical protein
MSPTMVFVSSPIFLCLRPLSLPLRRCFCVSDHCLCLFADVFVSSTIVFASSPKVFVFSQTAGNPGHPCFETMMMGVQGLLGTRYSCSKRGRSHKLCLYNLLDFSFGLIVVAIIFILLQYAETHEAVSLFQKSGYEQAHSYVQLRAGILSKAVDPAALLDC